MPDRKFSHQKIGGYCTEHLPTQLVDVLPALPDRETHVAWFCYENDTSQLLIDQAILCGSACGALEESHVLHFFTGQLDLGLKHHLFSASFKTSESPGSLTTIDATGKGFSHSAPRSRLLPWKT